MKLSSFIRYPLAILGALLLSQACFAQAWPSKSVRLIVPYNVGTANEVFSRVVAQKLAESWGQPVVVDAIPGAGGVVGTQVLAKAPADGYTLGWVSSPHAINAAIYPSLSYDSVKDFRAIANIANTPLVFVAGTGFLGNSIADLIARAKVDARELNFGSNGNGSASHLASGLLASMAGVRFAHIPYKATGQMTVDLVAGRIDFAALGLASALSLVRSGKLKALGVTGGKRAPSMPDVPVVAETVPGYEAKAWMGLVAPRGVSDAVVAKVEAAAVMVTHDKAVLSFMSAQGLEVEVLDSAQFARRIESEIRTWRKVVAETGVKVD